MLNPVNISVKEKGAATFPELLQFVFEAADGLQKG
jgi:hypothetical protein